MLFPYIFPINLFFPYAPGLIAQTLQYPRDPYTLFIKKELPRQNVSAFKIGMGALVFF